MLFHAHSPTEKTLGTAMGVISGIIFDFTNFLQCCKIQVRYFLILTENA